MDKLKSFFLIVSMTFLFQSYQGQQFDLEKLILPVKQKELKKFNLSASDAGVGTQAAQYSSYLSHAIDDGKLSLNFAKIEIEKAPDTDSFTQSMIRFYGKGKENNLDGFTLTIENEESFQKVLNYLLIKKEKFNLVFDDGKENEERARVFNCYQNNTIYLVLSRFNSKGKKVGYIDAIAAHETYLLTSRLGGAFGYYKEYLEYRKRKPANFSYLDFLKETDDELYKQNNNLH